MIETGTKDQLTVLHSHMGGIVRLVMRNPVIGPATVIETAIANRVPNLELKGIDRPP